MSIDQNDTPSLYASASEEQLDELRLALSTDPKIVAIEFEEWYTSLRSREKESALRVDVEQIDDVRQVAKEIRLLHEDGSYAPGHSGSPTSTSPCSSATASRLKPNPSPDILSRRSNST